MQFFSERRIERTSEYNDYYTYDGTKVTLNKQLNGEIGLSIPLENKLFGVTHIIVNLQTLWRGESYRAPASSLSFYVLPRTMRGRTAQAAQSPEWVKLDNSSIDIPAGKVSIITFEHNDLVKAGLKAESLTAAITISGNNLAGSSVETFTFRKATQDEVTDSVIEDETILITVNDIQSLVKSNHTATLTKLDTMDVKLDDVSTLLLNMDCKLDLLLGD